MSRCFSCMNDIKEASVCSFCGWSRSDEPESSLYIPAGHLLNSRYLIGDVIGAGGFGVVYVAWDNNLEVKVAIKEYLPKEHAARSSNNVSLAPYGGNSTEEFLYGMEKFLEEAKVLAKFQEHPGIVTVYESFRANNTAYMVTQYLDGMTLKDYLKAQPKERIPFETAINALTPIMDALREVHSAGFVHRDISPDNIFITRQKQVKLLDFGAARYALGEHSKSLTSVLKYGYAPVEQYSSKGNQGPWTDVYAVAATIYRCVTGVVPMDAMERVQGEGLKSPSALGANIPAIAERALLRALSLKASNRFVDILEFQKEIDVRDIVSPDIPKIQRVNASRAAEVFPHLISSSFFSDCFCDRACFILFIF